MTGGGIVKFQAAMTYTGGTTINNGTLVLGTLSGSTVGSLASTGAVTLGGGISGSGNFSGVLQLGDSLNPVNQTIAGLATSGPGTANAVVGGNSALSTLTLNVSGTDTYGGALGGAGTNNNNLALALTGGGTLQLTSASTYTGATTITGNSTLQLVNAASVNNISHSATISLAAGATLDTTSLSGGGISLGATTGQNLNGAGTVLSAAASGTTIVNSGSSLSPGVGASSSGGTIGTLTFGTSASGTNGNLTLNSGATLNFVLGTPGTSLSSLGTGSLIVVNGNLTLPASGLVFNPISNNNAGGLGSLGNGFYELFSYTGTLSGFTGNNFSTGSGAIYSFTNQNNQIDLQITTKAFTWTGQASSGGNATWDTTSSNWSSDGATFTNYGEGAAVTFYDGYFGPTISGGNAQVNNTNITIQNGGVHPLSITFNNNAVNYTLASSDANGVTGAAGITLSGTGTVTLLGAHSYGGATSIGSGMLVLGLGSSLGQTAISVAGGATLAAHPATGGTISVGSAGLGSLSLANGSTLDLSGDANAGTLRLAGGAAIGSSTGAAATLKFDLGTNGGGGTVVDALAATGAATLQGTNTIDIVGFGSARLTGGSYNLISAASGLDSGGTFTLATTSLTVDGFAYNLSLANSGTAEKLVVTAGLLQYIWNNLTGAGPFNFSDSGNWSGGAAPGGLNIDILNFGSGAAASYTATIDAAHDPWTAAGLTFANPSGVSGLIVNSNAHGLNLAADSGTVSITQSGQGAMTINSPLVLGSNTTLTLGATPIVGGLVTLGGANGGITQGGATVQTLTVTNSTAATLTALSVLQASLAGSNNFANGATAAPSLNVTSTAGGAITVLSLNSASALGSSASNSSLAPINMNSNAAAPQVNVNGTLVDSAVVLQIGATIGTDPGGNHADFSYQVVAETATPAAGQINLGVLANTGNGTGFAALGGNRTVALYTPVANSTTLATLQLKTQFGGGGGDHLTFGSPTANGMLTLLNAVDFNGGTNRRWQSVRGIGSVPEGNIAGIVSNSAANNANAVNFDGNGGLIFSNAGSTLGNSATGNSVTSYTINGGAVYIGANDRAIATSPGALGENATGMTIGSQNTSANLGFMTYGSGAGVGASATITTGRPISVTAGFTYGSVTLGGFTNDYSAFTGAITLNNTATPTTLIAAAGGRVDFTGQITGAGAVAIGNATVEGDSSAAGISLASTGTVVLSNSANNYSGGTTVSGGTLRIANASGSATGSGNVTVTGSGILAGGGSIGPTPSNLVTIQSGGTIVGSTAATLTINGALTLAAGAQGNFSTITNSDVFNPSTPNPLINVTGALNVSGTVMLTVPGNLSNGTYDLFSFGSNGNSFASSNFGFSGSVPSTYGISVTASQVDLTVMTSLTWTGHDGGTGATDHLWSTGSQPNWYNGAALAFSPTAAVVFGDGNPAATPGNDQPDGAVNIASGGVTVSSVTFTNTSGVTAIPGTQNGSVSYVLTSADGIGIAGTGATVTISGGGTVDFTGILGNSYTGVTTISGGSTLVISDNSALGSTSGTVAPLTFNGGTLRYAGSLGNTDISGRTVTINSSGATIDVNGHSVTYANGIGNGGGGALTVADSAGGGTLILTGTNNYSGGTTINSGATLQIGNLSSGTLGSGPVTANGALVFDTGLSTTITNNIGGASSGSLTVAGGSQVTLMPTTSNTYAGATLISNGTLVLGGNSALPAATAVTLGNSANNGSGALDLNGSSATVTGLSVASGATANNQVVSNDVVATMPSTLTFNGSGTSTYAGILADNGSGFSGQTLALSVVGGTLNLTNTNSYSGNTNVTGGTLGIGNGANNGNNSATGFGNVTVGNGSPGSGTLAASGTGGTIAPISGSFVMINNGGTIAGTSGSTLTINGPLKLTTGSTAAFNLAQSGAGNVTALIVDNGFLTVGASPAVTLSNSTALSAGDRFNLLSWSGGPSFSPTLFNLPSTIDGFTANWMNSTSNDLILTLTSSGSTAYSFTPPDATTMPTYPANFGSPTSFAVQSQSSPFGNYAGLQSSVTGGTTGPGSGAPLLTQAGGSTPLTATILAGTNTGVYTSGQTANLALAWRTRTTFETNGSSPPLPFAGQGGLISNVLSVTGMGTGPQAPGTGSVQTDPFALDMQYNPQAIPGLGNLSGSQLATVAEPYAVNGAIYLAWLDPIGHQGVSQQWVNAVNGNFNSSGSQLGAGANGADAKFGQDFQGSFNSFLSVLATDDPANFPSGTTAAGLSPQQLGLILGAYGVDNPLYESGNGSYDAWAVVNHNSQFAVVPEPSSLLLAALGLASLAGYRVRRRNIAAKGDKPMLPAGASS